MGLSTELIRQIGHHEDIQKLTFWALTLQQSERNLLSQRANTWNVRFWIIFFMVANSSYNQLCWKIQILCFTSPVTQHHHHHSFFRKNSFTLSIGLICCVKRSWYKVSALSWRFVRQEPLLATMNSYLLPLSLLSLPRCMNGYCQTNIRRKLPLHHLGSYLEWPK